MERVSAARCLPRRRCRTSGPCTGVPPGGLNSYKLEDKNLIFCLKYLQVLFDFHKAQMGVLVKRDWTEGEIVEAVGDDQSCRDLWIFPSRK